MSCKNSNNSNVCGQCSYDVMSMDFVRSKDIVKLSKVAANIVWMDQFVDTGNISSVFVSIKITCKGNILIQNKEDSNSNPSISVARDIYCKLINNWYSYNQSFKRYDSYKYIRQRLKYIQKCTWIGKIRTEAVSITKYLERIMTCDGNCSDVIPNKEIGKCRISLSDINKIVKLSSDGLVDTLNTILYTIKDLSVVNFTINLNTSYVTCHGTIVMDENFIKCKSTIGNMKGIYTYYLSAWCSANISKESQVTKIRFNIKQVQQAKSMAEIYDLSSDLLNEL